VCVYLWVCVCVCVCVCVSVRAIKLIKYNNNTLRLLRVVKEVRVEKKKGLH
jgi:hypothetical protein